MSSLLQKRHARLRKIDRVLRLSWTRFHNGIRRDKWNTFCCCGEDFMRLRMKELCSQLQGANMRCKVCSALSTKTPKQRIHQPVALPWLRKAPKVRTHLSNASLYACESFVNPKPAFFNILSEMSRSGKILVGDGTIRFSKNGDDVTVFNGWKYAIKISNLFCFRDLPKLVKTDCWWKSLAPQGKI